MEDVSVLLNFTSKVAFEETDPLMSLISARKPLLFYDRLSVGECETEESERYEQARRKIKNLRNLLDARSLSSSADNGKIRLIVILDLAGGLFQVGDTKLFPAQKVRLFRELITNTFEPENPVLKRIEYSFIFLCSDADPMADFYLPLSYDGISGGDGRSWLATTDVRLNSERDKVIKNMNSPDEEWSLSNPEVKPLMEPFISNFETVKDKVSQWLGEVDAKEAFRVALEEMVKGVKTVGQFKAFEYDEAVKACLKKLIGLGAVEFRNDCVFFIHKFDEDNNRAKERDGIFVKSLVQLLSTIEDDDYQKRFKTQSYNAGARLFTMGKGDALDVNTNAIDNLRRHVLKCLSELDHSIWTEDMDVVDEKGVKGFFEYFPNSIEPHETDTHSELNAKNKKERDKNQAVFRRIRRVPFFFGKKIGDWEWYRAVLNQVMTIYDFEVQNDRPLFDPPKRITNNEMYSKKQQANYTELKDLEAKRKRNIKEIPQVGNLSAYMKHRRELMEDFAAAIEKLKKEMPKLGYFTCLFWMGLLSILGFTLCYAFHFFWFDNMDPYYLVAISFGAAGLLFVLASLIGQACVKKRIHAIYREIDNIYDQLQKNLENYLKEVNLRVKLQREADINRRNLDEIEDKQEIFQYHNNCIGIWRDHFASIAQKLTYSLECIAPDVLDEGDRSEKKAVEVRLNDAFCLGEFPKMPYEIRREYENMQTKILNTPVTIDHVTCFVKHFHYSER